MIYAWLKKLFTKTRVEKILEECGCCCYCPGCKEPLNDTSKCEAMKEYGMYRYTCAACSETSVFHFGIAPVPIWLEEEK